MRLCPIWTGTEMIIWGGQIPAYDGIFGFPQVDTGLRYCGKYCTPPVYEGIQSAHDFEACKKSGIMITWPLIGDWGNGATDGTYELRRYYDFEGKCAGAFTTIDSSISSSQDWYLDETTMPGLPYRYLIVATNNCDIPLSSTGTNSCSNAVFDNIGHAPAGLNNNVAIDIDQCENSGVLIGWNADPADWGDNGYGTRTYDILHNGIPIVTSLPYGTTAHIDTTGTNGILCTYKVSYHNGCNFSAVTVPGTQAKDESDSLPCPSISNTLFIGKAGTIAVLSWDAVICLDFVNYRVYGSTSYSTPFPSAWAVLGNPGATIFNDPLDSNYIAYKILSVDACGNLSPN